MCTYIHIFFFCTDRSAVGSRQLKIKVFFFFSFFFLLLATVCHCSFPYLLCYLAIERWQNSNLYLMDLHICNRRCLIYSIPFVFTVPAYVMADNNIGTDKMFIQMHEKKTQQAKKKKTSAIQTQTHTNQQHHRKKERKKTV